MKAENLKYPYSWENRKVMLGDKILFVPDKISDYESFSLPEWEKSQIFGNDLPVRLEYCSGNGQWICSKADEDRKSNWIALEKRFDRVQKIWARGKRMELSNLFTIFGEAFLSTKHYIRSGSIDEVFVNFPDPWPKRRHAKHRIIQKEFVDEVYRILKAKTPFTLVTDDKDYAAIMVQEMLEHPGFTPQYKEPFYITHLDGYGTSFFEQLWKEQGKTIHYITFIKKDS